MWLIGLNSTTMFFIHQYIIPSVRIQVPSLFSPSPCSDMGPPIAAGPPSASLLQDWLDVRQLDPDDMDALQRELATGNPDMFLQGVSEL